MGLVDIIKRWRGPKLTPDEALAEAEKAISENRMKDACNYSFKAMKLANFEHLSATRIYVEASIELRRFFFLETYCNKLVEKDPENPESWYLKGKYLAKRHAPNIPVPECGYFMPEDYRSNRAFTPQFKQDQREASDCLDKALRLDKPEGKMSGKHHYDAIRLSAEAFNCKSGNPNQEETNEKIRQMKAMEKWQQGYLAGRYRDPDSH